MTDTHTDMAAYYAQRACEYERIYAKPERQEDLRKVESLVEEGFPGLKVLEIACGTGYWTRFIAKSADAILATDCNPEVIELARQKDYGECEISFEVADAYTLSHTASHHEAGFAGFWWSHVPKSRITDFVTVFHSKLQKPALVLFIDNTYVEGSSTPISHADTEGNTYQTRKLRDGSEHSVLKNFPTEEELIKAFESYAIDMEFIPLEYYWGFRYRTK